MYVSFRARHNRYKITPGHAASPPFQTPDLVVKIRIKTKRDWNRDQRELCLINIQSSHCCLIMKLIVAGATGLIGGEVIRQSLRHPEIDSVVALARKPVQVDEAHSKYASKLKSVVVEDYEKYPDHVKAELSGADACIWCVQICPERRAIADHTGLWASPP